MSAPVLVEDALHTFIAALIAAAQEGDSLHGAQLTETVFGGVTAARCVQIGPCKPRLAPAAGAEAAEEFDADAVLVFLSKVADPRDDAAYAAARRSAVGMGHEVALAIFNNNDLSGAVRDALPDVLPRDFTTIAKEPYAVANLVVGVNVAGGLLPGAKE